MNKVEANPEKIGEESASTRVDRKDRKKHKRRERKGEGSSSKSKSSSHRSKEDSTTRDKKKKHSSSKKEKKKKHKKRSPSPNPSGHSDKSSKGEDESPPAAAAATTKRPSSESGNDDSSVSSIDSVEASAPAVFEVFTRDLNGVKSVMEREPSKYIRPTKQLSSDESESEESHDEEEVEDRKPAADKHKEPKRAPRRRIKMDRHKKELIGACTPDQVAVPRKPAGLSRVTATPKQSISSAEGVGSQKKEETIVKEGSTLARALSGTDKPSSARHQPTALKPLKSNDDNRHKKELMRELSPDQFMTVSRPAPKFGRRGSGDTAPQMSGSTPSLTAGSSVSTLDPIHESLASSPPSPSGKTVDTDLTESTSTFESGAHHKNHFGLPSFGRKARRKSINR